MKRINETQLKGYKEMVAASPDTMESKIRAHLKENCTKFDESKFDGCMEYLLDCAAEILARKNGEIPDEICYKICRDYYDDELWNQKDAEDDEEKDETPEVHQPTDKTAELMQKYRDKYGTKPEKTEAQKVEEKNRALIAENNKKLGIGMAKTIDMFSEAV